MFKSSFQPGITVTFYTLLKKNKKLIDDAIEDLVSLLFIIYVVTNTDLIFKYNITYEAT